MLTLDINLAIATAIVVFAGIVRGFSGFAAAMILVPGFSLIYSPPVAATIMLLLEAPALVHMVPQTYRHADWRAVWPLALAAAVVTPAGAYLLLVVDPVLMRRAIGLVVLAFVFVLVRGWRYRGTAGPGMVAAIGASSGLIGAATGIGGPPIILYFMSVATSARQVRANITSYWALRFMAVFAAYAWYGLMTGDLILFCVALAPVYVAAIWIGGRLFHRATESVFRRIASVIVSAMGLLALVG